MTSSRTSTCPNSECPIRHVAQPAIVPSTSLRLEQILEQRFCGACGTELQQKEEPPTGGQRDCTIRAQVPCDKHQKEGCELCCPLGNEQVRRFIVSFRGTVKDFKANISTDTKVRLFFAHHYHSSLCSYQQHSHCICVFSPSHNPAYFHCPACDCSHRLRDIILPELA